MSFEDYKKRYIQNYYNAKDEHLTGSNIDIPEKGKSVITQPVNSALIKKTERMHGMFYFKLIDEATHAALQAYEEEFLLVTANLSMNMTKGVKLDDVITAEGKYITNSKRLFTGEAILKNQNGEVVGHGAATFAKSRVKLN